MKREPLKVGERVRVFGMDMGPKGFADGAIKLPENEFGAVLVEVADGVVSAHPRQCVRLRRRERSEKRERVVRWVSAIAAEDSIVMHKSPVGIAEPIRLVELRPGEVVLSRAELAKAWNEMCDKTDTAVPYVGKGNKYFTALCAALSQLPGVEKDAERGSDGNAG